MRQNVGMADALARGVLAGALVVVGVSGEVHGLLSFAAVLGGLILMATALTRECPLYRVLHIATARAASATSRVRRG
jgi:Protein of unknown function (DUF2892)